MNSTVALQQTPTGWSLVSDRGVVIFSAAGARARRDCLLFAQGARFPWVRSVP